MKKIVLISLALSVGFMGCIRKERAVPKEGILNGFEQFKVVYVFSGVAEEVLNKVYENSNIRTAHILIDEIEVRKNEKENEFYTGKIQDISSEKAMQQLEYKKKQWQEKFPNKKIIKEEVLYLKQIPIGIFIRYESRSAKADLFLLFNSVVI